MQYIIFTVRFFLLHIPNTCLTFHKSGLDKHFGHISTSTFPLPTLGPILTSLAKELHTGRGFFVLRTIPVSSYSRADNVLIYTGISSYIGSTRGLQDKNGGVLSHIKDLTPTHRAEEIGGPAYTTDKQVAEEGGVSRISSSWKVYNEIANTRPDLIKTLAEPWFVDGYV